MKRILAVLCVAVMIMGMPFSALAAPSVQVSGVVTKIASATDANGNPINITIQNSDDAAFSEEEKAAVEEIKNMENLKALLGDKFVEGMKVLDIKNIIAPAGTVFPVTITFEVPGVSEDTKAVVLHYDTDKKAWEMVDTKAGNGTITATFTSLSPVAFVVDGKAADAANTATTKATTSTQTLSPKTGESNVILYACVVAGIALTGMGVVSFRKKRV